MTKIIIVFTSLFLYAQTQDICSKNQGCSSAPKTLESVLEKGKKNDNKKQLEKKEAVKQEAPASLPPAEIPAPKEETAQKKSFENPQYLSIWIVILIALYFYLKDKKKKGKK